MPYIQRINKSGGLFRSLVSFVFTAIAGFFLYITLFVLTAIAVYFTKKIERKAFDPRIDRSNIIYLNFASKPLYKKRFKKLP